MKLQTAKDGTFSRLSIRPKSFKHSRIRRAVDDLYIQQGECAGPTVALHHESIMVGKVCAVERIFRCSSSVPRLQIWLTLDFDLDCGLCPSSQGAASQAVLEARGMKHLRLNAFDA